MNPRPAPRPRARPGARRRGASLVEALLASLILALMAAPLFAMLEGSTRIFSRADAAAGLHNDLRTSAERMVRDLRTVGYDPSATGVAAYFEVASASTVRFVADVDGDGVTDRVEYAYDAAARTLTRQFWRWAGIQWGPGSGALVAARNVDAVTFSYFDAVDGAPAALGDIRRVTVAVAASRLVAGHGLERYTVSSEARVRNLP